LNPLDIFLPIWNPLVGAIEEALRYLTTVTGSAGLAIIIFTIGVRTGLIPLALMQARSQRAMLRLQPQLRELQQKYGSDRQKMAQEQMRLYKEGGYSPFTGCLPLVIQMPIWFALYSALRNLAGSDEAFQGAFLWIPSLASHDPLYILPVLTAGTQWVVQRMSMVPSADPQQQQMNRMMEFMPLMFFFFALQYGAGLAVYWTVSNVYSIAQQYFTVGWGTLPFLGTKPPPSDSGKNSGGSPPNGRANGKDESRTPRARRNGASTPGRRRRGK
jgi:YidC/Oxa1 family membrane protein insertase